MLKKLINFIGNPDVDSLSSVSDAISVLTLSRQFEIKVVLPRTNQFNLVSTTDLSR